MAGNASSLFNFENSLGRHAPRGAHFLHRLRSDLEEASKGGLAASSLGCLTDR
ncbi:hypothetical protein D3C77_266960 [compost metagenome]